MERCLRGQVVRVLGEWAGVGHLLEPAMAQVLGEAVPVPVPVPGRVAEEPRAPVQGQDPGRGQALVLEVLAQVQVLARGLALETGMDPVPLAEPAVQAPAQEMEVPPQVLLQALELERLVAPV